MSRLAAVLALGAVTAAAGGDGALLDLRVVGRDGTVVTLRERVGSAPTLLAAWATYCPPCRAEVPVLNEAALRWKTRGVRVLGLALETDGARVERARHAWGIDYETVRIAPDEGEVVARLFPKGLPASAFAAGGTVTRHDRILSREDVDRLVPELLGVPPLQ